MEERSKWVKYKKEERQCLEWLLVGNLEHYAATEAVEE